MNLNFTLEYVRKIQKIHSDYLLCGSLALVLYGVLDFNEKQDVDFVSKDIGDGIYLSHMQGSETCIDDNRYKHYFCKEGDCSYCLFENKALSVGRTICDIRLQSFDQILFWKNEFGRDKDKTQLSEINKNICKRCINGIEGYKWKWNNLDDKLWPNYMRCPKFVFRGRNDFKISSKYIEVFNNCPFKLEHLISVNYR